MKPLFIFVITALSFLTKGLSAQEVAKRDAFISINSGICLPSMNNFKRIYDSRFAFNNGLSIGVPFTNSDIYFYSKAMYFKKEGIPIIYHFESNNGVPNNYTTREGMLHINNF